MQCVETTCGTCLLIEPTQVQPRRSRRPRRHW